MMLYQLLRSHSIKWHVRPTVNDLKKMTVSYLHVQSYYVFRFISEKQKLSNNLHFRRKLIFAVSWLVPFLGPLIFSITRTKETDGCNTHALSTYWLVMRYRRFGITDIRPSDIRWNWILYSAQEHLLPKTQRCSHHSPELRTYCKHRKHWLQYGEQYIIFYMNCNILI
jgi:hypothetical protein